MKRIGIMGGTFDPIHYGHIHIAEAAFDKFHLDKVWFMPNSSANYKEGEIIATDEQRKEMIWAAIEPYSHFELNTMELERGGETYTVDTLRILAKDYPDDEFYFIMGYDSLEHFLDWKEPKEILEHAKILVAPRHHSSDEKIKQKIEKVEKKLEVHGRIQLLPLRKLWRSDASVLGAYSFKNIDEMKLLHTDNISSTEIRNCIRERRKTLHGDVLRLRDVVPEPVYHYLHKNKLYAAV